MKQKFMFLLSALVVFSLLISPVGSVRAQDPQPPRRSPTPYIPPHYPPPGGFKDGEDTGKEAFQTLSAGIMQNDVQASVALGQSGLSFRYAKTFGTTTEPYLADENHLNKPNGLFIDPANNLYVVEEDGDRLLKFNALGANTLTIGHAGQSWHHDDFLATPVDDAVDASGNIWVVIQPAIKEFDASGNLIQIFPELNPWEGGDANDRFNNPWGIAFDASGKMYISDQGNHRIQVYDVSGGTPSYVETIGETGVPHSDNNGFSYPGQIAFDSLGRLYVMDAAGGNFRVQRCVKNVSWTCTIFFGEPGVEGNDLSHLSWALGLTIRNDNVYIADGGNHRVLKCTTGGACSHFAGENGVVGSDNSHFRWISDVAVDSFSNVYVSDLGNYRIQKFNSAGVYQSTIGITGVPYLTDTNHINTPWGVAVNSTGDVYAVEHLGYRLLKYNSAGAQQWSVGIPGVDDGSGGQFGGGFRAGPEGNPAIDASGRIYVSDTVNNWVQVYNSNGTYFTTLGNGWGQGNYEFSCPTGVAISPVNGDVYVTDHCNQRVQVFTSALVYKATLGETDVQGDDNSHFRWPWGVAVANNGDIFVADSDNFRVQKCHFTTGVNYTCSTFAGETGVGPDGTYTHIHPMSVAVDASNRVYVATDWDNRVQVYNSAGAFLASIGGDWSELTGGLRFPAGVAVDNAGNVYLSDHDNHRIQKFAPGVPGWVQSNIDGFGDPNVSVLSLGTFNNTLYAGGVNETGVGAGIWSTTDGSNWTQMMSGGFGNSGNAGIDHLFAYNGYLFAGTYNNAGGAGELWRSNNGTIWTPVTTNGFGDVNNGEIYRFVSFNNKIYASTWNGNAGTQIWRDDDGAPHTTGQFWEKVVNAGFNDGVTNHVNNAAVISFEVFDPDGAGTTYTPYLFAGTLNGADGGEVWRSTTGNAGDWEWVNTNGFGDSDNFIISALASFNGYLYAVTNHRIGGAAELWRCHLCDGSDWTDVTSIWSLDTETRRMPALEVFGNRLYLVIGNNAGLEVWRSADGLTWEQVGSGGLNTSLNYSSYYDNALTVFNNELYLGTLARQGGDVWKKVVPFADVHVEIGGLERGSYTISEHTSTRQNYAGLDSGPVRVTSMNNTPIVAALRDLWWNGSAYTSSIQLMGLPESQLSDTYLFPSYNNVTLNDQLRFGNVGNTNTTVTVTIGGVVRGTYLLAPSQRQKVNYVGLDSGPVIVHSSNGVPIIASIRDAWINNGVTSSFSQLMGLPQSQLSDTYIFPSYNNVSLSDQLRFGNVGNAPTTVTVTIGGQLMGSYYLLPNQRDKASYAGLDSGPVVVKSSNGVPIIASLREAWLNNGVTTSYFQMMGLPQSQLSDKYVFPVYDNVSLSGQLRFGNVGNANTTVSITIGGQFIGSYDLAPNQRQKVSYMGLDDGPIVVQSSNGVPIIAALRDAWLVNGVTNSFSQLMGLPGGQISTTYVFPSYNNATYDNQLRIGVP